MGCPIANAATLTPSTAGIMNKIFALLLLVVIAATVANASLLKCLGCGEDIEKDIKDCAKQDTTQDKVNCALDAMKTTADCLDCVCNILASVFKLDSGICDRKTVNLVPNQRIH